MELASQWIQDFKKKFEGHIRVQDGCSFHLKVFNVFLYTYFVYIIRNSMSVIIYPFKTNS